LRPAQFCCGFEQIAVCAANVALRQFGAFRMPKGIRRKIPAMATQSVNFSKAPQAAPKGLELGRGNPQAMTQSTRAYMSGMQDLSGLYLRAIQDRRQQVLGSGAAFAGAKPAGFIRTRAKVV
jgi:hypothetical protein